MKLLSVSKKSLMILFIIILNFSGCSIKQNEIQSKSELTPGIWRFQGHLGNYIDKISQQRILKKTVWKIIYPETEDAFGIKEDDKYFPKYGRWRGEFWGKYMLSVIAAAKYYRSEELKDRIAGAVDGLLSHMEKDGYLGTYAKSDFLVGNNWNIWCRKYTLWGLVACWELLQDPKILNAAKKFTDHLISQVGPNALDIVTTGNFYGMPSMSILQPMVKLYNATAAKKYLDYAEYIVNQWTQHPEGLPDILNKGLSGKPVHNWFPHTDPYKWAKGYEFTSCVEGLVELYKITKKADYLKAAKNIHQVLINYERTPVGSVSFNDKFVGSAGLINCVAEICDAVYWNRLSYELFKLTAEGKYIDEIERTLYNSLLCAFNSEGTWGLRRLRTSHIHIPAQNHFLKHHQCCTDNAPRGLFQAAEVALLKRNEREIFLCLFNEGEGEIKLEKDIIRFKIEEDFLSNSMVKTTVNLDKSRNFQINIRRPHWSKKTSVKINQLDYRGEIFKNWLRLEREWNNGDVIEILFELDLRWEAFEPEKFDSTFHNIDFFKKEWAKMKFLGGTYKFNNERYKHVIPLDKNEALPQQKALTFFYGPIALARDIRVSGQDIFSPISEPKNKVSIKTLPTPPNIWKLFEINLGEEHIIRFCDFSSAGNTWDKKSLFNTWCLVEK
jgi:DUF1680 family protein